MKFHGILVIRDEEDVIDQTLSHLLEWCDFIYVYDTGSIDNTWDIVQEYGSKFDCVVPFKKERVVFEDWIRGIVFDRYRDRAQSGDWWLRLDADEFYHIPPPEFVRQYVGRHESLIYKQTYEFRLTDAEVEAWEQGKETIDDRSRHIEERRRYYELLEYPEPRMFQYRPKIKWMEASTFPFNAGYPAQKRIPVRHYPHRDPLQLKKRSVLRSVGARVRGDMDVRHWRVDDWRDLVVSSEKQGLQYWGRDTDLPSVDLYNHMPKGLQRMVKLLLYAGPVRILDQLRSGFDKSCSPTPFPEEAQEEVRRAYEQVEEEEEI